MVVEKMIVQDHTELKLTVLKKEERTKEIARMLGGIKITEQTLAHAEEMLKNS
jgi:DNA repair protein RecN (Recombination protein N)